MGTVRLSRIDKDSKEARNKRIFGLWMACHTQEEIAEREGVKQQAIDQILQKMAGLPNLVKSDQSKAEFADDFEIPIYNVWKFNSTVLDLSLVYVQRSQSFTLFPMV